MGVLPVGRKARRISLFLFALLLCGAAALAAAHLRAWYHYRAAQSALDLYHFAEARKHLAISLKGWSNSWRVHLLAARAARLDGRWVSFLDPPYDRRSYGYAPSWRKEARGRARAAGHSRWAYE